MVLFFDFFPQDMDVHSDRWSCSEVELLWKFRNRKIYTTDFEKHCGYVGSSALEEYVKIQANNLFLCLCSVNTQVCTHITKLTFQFVALLFTAFIKE